MYWERATASKSFQWNTYRFNIADEQRPEFHGELQKDPVTRHPVLYYPSWKRRLWYVFSLVTMLPLLSLGVLAMTLSLNLNGYVKDKHSPIYVEYLASFAEPGGVFATDSPYFGWLVPTVLHSIIIASINRLYGIIAERCTELENHRTIQSSLSSLVIKRVSFECFDCFMPLFYIAFYQMDVDTLRAEIVSLFMSDEIRRILLESLLPLLKYFITKTLQDKKQKSTNTPSPLPADVALAEYDVFDDYLEMVIQFGYITLFSSVFSLGPVVTLVFLFLELRSDLFKLVHAYKRPVPRRVKDIGVWLSVMKAMVFVSILTNCAILGFASEQMMQWLPSLFTRRASDGDQTMAMGSGRYVVGLVFGTEHVLLLVALFLQWAIPPVPKRVRIAIARREFLTQQRMAREAAITGTEPSKKTD